MCKTWTEHKWGLPRFLEAGKHDSLGHYQRFLVCCEDCGTTTTETRWLDLPVSEYVGIARQARGA